MSAGLPRATAVVDGRLLPAGITEEVIRAVVHGFYDRVRRDELLGPVFERAIVPEKWPAHLARMCDFWSSVLLRTERYDGRPLQPHLGLPVDDAHFRRWLSLFEAVVAAHCDGEARDIFMERAVRIAHSFRLAIAFQRGEDTTRIAPILASDSRSGEQV